METATTRDYLLRLREVILQERACAKALDMEGMAAAVQTKQEILEVLAHIKSIAEEDRALAAEIRAENRRNAFLFKSTLGWIRETMEFFGRRTAPTTYSAAAGTVTSQIHGRLLSGKI
jgi:flagellar biosynthesis/type III secretory pathway chaperone